MPFRQESFDMQTTISDSSSMQAKKSPRRRLEHLADLADGFDQWDMINRRLSRAFIDGKFPAAKFRLLLCFMSHGEGFHVKRAYLEKRFSDATIKKYCAELELEGCIRIETLPSERGGVVNLYHVQSLRLWKLYDQIDDPLEQVVRKIADPHQRGPREGGGLKEPNLKDLKEDLNPTHKARARMDLFESQSETKPEMQEHPRVENPLEPTTGNPELRGPIADMVLAAKNQGLFVQPNDLANNIGLAMQNLQAPFTLIQEQWPIAVLRFLESKQRNPASAFFGHIKAELAYIKRQRQYDEKAAAKQVYNGKKRGHREPAPVDKMKLESKPYGMDDVEWAEILTMQAEEARQYKIKKDEFMRDYFPERQKSEGEK